MRAPAPAPAWTTTSRPRALNFLTVSGVAATRVSPPLVSFGTARRIGGSRSAGAEHREQDHDQHDPRERPFGEGQETGISLLMLADVHGTDLVVVVVRHSAPQLF